MLLLQESILHSHPIWSNVFFYLFVGLSAIFFIVALTMMKFLRKRTSEMKLMQQQYLARIDGVRKDHTETLERIRLEMLKREEERTRQWIESEKETLHVLNGVSNLLDLSDKLDKSDSAKILKKLDEISEKVTKITLKE